MIHARWRAEKVTTLNKDIALLIVKIVYGGTLSCRNCPIRFLRSKRAQCGGRRHSHKTFTFWSSHPSSALRLFIFVFLLNIYFIIIRIIGAIFSTNHVMIYSSNTYKWSSLMRKLSTLICRMCLKRTHECNNKLNALAFCARSEVEFNYSHKKIKIPWQRKRRQQKRLRRRLRSARSSASLIGFLI